MIRCLVVVLSVACLGAAHASAPAPDEAPLTIDSVADSYDVQADGTYVNLYRVALHVGNDAMARRQGQQAFGYSPQSETLEVVGRPR